MICKGFFMSHLHIDNHFAWLSNSSSMLDSIRENLISQIGHMEKYLLYKNQTLDLVDKIGEIDRMCETEYQGSQLFKYMSILVRKIIKDSSNLRQFACREW